MRKILMIAVVAFLGIVTATAQDYKWFVGGELGFWSGKEDGLKTTTYGIAPEIGYNVSDKFAVAISAGYQSFSEKYGNYKSSYEGFIINPYVRYTFLKSGIVSAFVDGGATFGLSDFDGFEIGLKPGVAIALTERFSVVAHIGFLGYNDGKGIGNSELGKGFGLDFSGYQASFGFYYSF
ncbi:MAG: porin family protein [Prevotellaceae bacterium]|jgi:hypothetical protein|nr:porin family protein [Prevotellaceae bacterium]